MTKLSIYLLSIVILFGCTSRETTKDTIIISGIVKDFNGNPIDSSIIDIKYKDFSTAYKTYTDAEGRYSIEIKKGRYASIYAMRLNEYPRNNAVPEEDMRLEFWAWNVIADRDMEINPHYHKLELYGTTVFKTVGGYPGYFVYFRPMSVTKYISYDKAVYLNKGKAEQVSDISIKPEHLKVKVFADDKALTVNSVVPVEEFSGIGNMTITGYVVQVDDPGIETDKPYIIFRVEAENTEYKEFGENLYFYEIPDFE
ncbi:carboxypeptidase-like regulatory domain-containing protein [Bacteroides sp. 519]|uniref:carboxypeptidase-like regulatory domain-containing protein n=1 Tax=Bacteroides sp. 519 TaxID=2302937 RepID=UPI0013D82B3A|nr:carboxypeptidase-like regulatory domain-containing protein [Bacteroides sp. 519]NDV59987.1 carboxypeptidase regulatory-like domain-containing protein [Bacteroides sp. 519]